MPNWNAFEQQSEEYKESVIPSSVTKRVAIEMASPLGWHKYVGTAGKVIAIDGFGASAPGDLVVEKYGFTKKYLKPSYELIRIIYKASMFRSLGCIILGFF